MSTDWQKYATPYECRLRATQPARNGVVELSVVGVRDCPPMSVVHTPRPQHRSHTDVMGITMRRTEVQVKVRLHLYNMVGPRGWVIQPDAPLDG